MIHLQMVPGNGSWWTGVETFFYECSDFSSSVFQFMNSFYDKELYNSKKQCGFKVAGKWFKFISERPENCDVTLWHHVYLRYSPKNCHLFRMKLNN